jgi:hypothetical protein
VETSDEECVDTQGKWSVVIMYRRTGPDIGMKLCFVQLLHQYVMKETAYSVRRNLKCVNM